MNPHTVGISALAVLILSFLSFLCASYGLINCIGNQAKVSVVVALASWTTVSIILFVVVYKNFWGKYIKPVVEEDMKDDPPLFPGV